MGVFDLLDSGAAAVLAEVVGEEQARALVEGWRELDQEAQAYRWLTERGFEPALARKVVALYSGLSIPATADEHSRAKGPVVWHLEDDPYRMLAFAPWTSVDGAARRMGIVGDDSRRLAAAAEAVLAKRVARGHTWMATTDLVVAVARLLRVTRALAERAIALAVERKAAVPHTSGYQLTGCYVMERLVVERCHAMTTGGCVPQQLRLETQVTRSLVESDLDDHCAADAYRLNAEQREAVWMALTAPLCCLVGGPGVGKTTVLRAVHALSERYHRRIVQAGLSGRAAQRMAEATGRPASTIASLLLRIERGEERLDDEPQIVIDEASMVDLPSFYRLIREAPPGVRLMLVGDPGQLPPVGFGLTFHLLAESSTTPRATLTQVMRQTDASGIPQVCRAIRGGTVPSLPEWSQERRDGVSFLSCAPREIADFVIDLLSILGGHPAVQVIGSIKPGAGGVTEINYRLHTLAAVGASPLAERFFVGQPVIATRNDYEVDVMNGELGTVRGNGPDGGLRVQFDAGEKLLPQSYLKDLELAYAITCHKSQGSQFRRVIVPVTASRLLDRSLLLTAVSRAQEQVVMVGDFNAFRQSVISPATSLSREVGLGR